MNEYERFCKEKLPGKIPDQKSSDFPRRVGDCIYDFSNSGPPKLRDSVHSEANRDTDLAGKNALLSECFYYFGDKPVALPSELHPIIHRTQGHKSCANSEYQDAFVKWLEGIGFAKNGLHGEPQFKSDIMKVVDCRGICAAQDKKEDENDEIC